MLRKKKTEKSKGKRISKLISTLPKPDKKGKAWGAINAVGEKVFPLHLHQTRIMKAEARFTAAIAGTGGGKTVLGPLWIMKRIEALQEQGILGGMKGMIIAPTYKILSRATAPTLVDTFRDTEFEGRFLESKNQYILPRGLGILYLLSSDEPKGLEGGQLDIGAWLDEGGQMTYSAWLAVSRRTGVNQAPIFITTTPYLVNWLKTEILDEFLQGDRDYFVECWASVDNPGYPRAEFERARRKLPKAIFEMMYMAKFTSLEGLVYPDLPKCVVEHRLIEGKVGKNVGGLDFGWRAPFCGLTGTLVVEEGKDVLYIWAERYRTKCQIERHAKELPKAVYYADPSEPELISRLNTFGLVTHPANNDVTLGIDLVNDRITSNRLKISDTCINLLREASLYQYPEDGNDENPVKGLDHAMDALRYIVASIDKRRVRRKEKPMHVLFSRSSQWRKRKQVHSR